MVLWFSFSAGVVSLKDTFDFESLGTTTGLTMDITVTDDSGEADTGTMTFNFENKNEAPTISITTNNIIANEGAVMILIKYLLKLYLND